MRLNKFTGEIEKTYAGKTILISGAFGYIGSLLTSYLLEIDCKLILLDKVIEADWLPKDKRAKCVFQKGDITDRHTWELSLPGVDFLFHLAALEYDRLNFDIMGDLVVNGLAVAYCLDVCRVKGYRPKIVFSSSANIFGLVNQLPVDEKFKDDPISLWSIHKLLAENYIRYYVRKHAIQSVILRLSNIYGPTDNLAAKGNVVINKVIMQALSGKPIKLYANKECIRDYIYISDVVMAFLLAGKDINLLPEQNSFLIGSGEGRTMEEVWRLIADKTATCINKEVKIEIDRSVQLEPFDMRNFVADTSQFEKFYGWRPTVFMEEGVSMTIDSLYKNKEERKNGQRPN
jgi:nucleoside-diphosphate-sugar epimerase